MGRGIIRDDVTDNAGNAIQGKEVTIYIADTVTKATLYDASTGGSEIGNPVVTDEDGVFEAYADTGEYEVEIDGQIEGRYNAVDGDELADLLAIKNIGGLTTADKVTYDGESANVKLALDARVPSYLVSEVAALTGPVGKNIIIADRDHSIWEAVAPGSPDGYSRLAGNGVDWVLAESGELTAKMFGVSFDGGIDDAAAAQAAFDYVKLTDRLLVFNGGTALSNSALDATDVRRLRMDGEIHFANNTDGLTIGTTGNTTTDMARADLRVRVRGPKDVAGTTGVICKGMWRSEVTAHVDGFEYGFEHRMTSGQYVAGCTFNLTLRRCRVKLRFNSSSTAFCSDNRYPGLVALEQDEALAPTIGVEWADNTAPSNNNIFDKAWLENNDVPIKFAGECSFNKFYDARLEGAGAIEFGPGGQNGGANGNRVTSDVENTELSFWAEYTSTSPYPNFVDSGIFAHERTLVSEISYRDWRHRTNTANRNWFCPKMVSTLYGNNGGFSFGPDYFDWATLDAADRSFKITNFDEGYFDVPVSQGDQFYLGIHHDETSVAANYAIVRLEAIDASKAALPSLTVGELPYVGTTRGTAVGTTGTGHTVNIQNDRAERSSGIRINRSEVKFLRVVLRYDVKFYKVSLFALHDRYSRPAGGDRNPDFLPLKYIDSFSEQVDFTGQLARIRGGELMAVGVEGKWRGVGFQKGRVSLSGGTATVSLGYTMPSTAYHVVVSGGANETFWWASKTTTGFAINSSNVSSTAQVEWIVTPP